jgi:orotidine 5'-phosphate decarboxylase subfamily 1
MDAAAAWGERWSSMHSPIARRYMATAARSKSLVCLAADRPTTAEVLDLIRKVGPFLAALKTHVDLVEDWTADGWNEVRAAADAADLLLFEDRKFADIGGITRNQMHGLYGIAGWSDLVTAHLISGPDIVDGCHAAWADRGREGGVLLLAQMSSRGNLLAGEYSDAVVRHGLSHDGVFGFIGNGSRAEELRDLRGRVGQGRMIWTPGVNLVVGDGAMGQRYGDPREAVLAGSDAIIVGSGIHRAEQPAEAAAAYAEASWSALLERTGA